MYMSPPSCDRPLLDGPLLLDSNCDSTLVCEDPRPLSVELLLLSSPSSSDLSFNI